MKLLSLKLEGYKNLKNKEQVSFNFSDCKNYCALVGLNGSGKSNLLEALSEVFSSLYHNSSCSLQYEIEYTISTSTVQVINGEMSLDTGEKVNKKDHFKYLPSNVIASYSGEDNRMWEGVYLNSYADFFKDIKKQTSFVPQLLYINKYTWEYALIALLSSEDTAVLQFVKEILKIGEDVEVKFAIDETKYGLYENNEALAFVKRLASLQKDSPTGAIPIQTISSLDLGHRDNKELSKKLFYYLFITGMPVKSELVKADKIIKKTEIEFDGIDILKLSEGEKKLILINAIIHILSDDKTLVLLDEPDAHVHIERKKEIINSIDKEDRFTLFSTHSPKILNCIDENNIRLVKNNSDTGVEIIHLDKINTLNEITNGEFSVIDATLALSTNKDILLVEGELDYKYINEALLRLNRLRDNKYEQFNFLIINCGGAGNIPAIFKEIVAPHIKPTQFCLATFDADKAGKDGIEGMNKILRESPMSNVETMTHTTPNDWEEGKEFYMEDYFPLDVYKPILLADIERKSKIKDFQQLTKNTVKNIIESNYRQFNDDAYVKFEILLDSIIEKQTSFHS
ncbi:ATP-dependent nuclease [Flammeovirga kamogawensis]|uniref:AAA family ATPase n=1 Tax=Flammeovirga kamogawensis TaxID=373891 RepID=A0ABX8H497_9BACT|nr:ATP-binding protein [Flammeovirga kamogawensis]MBB6461972.1 ABC-type lipoprotein export system ATPase subunit [Flammeovirga kamogawensis]QWG10424.1 AAA family ATPase [Flammeovirga kamogawensis]TRX63934.1 AAA family ATPase [Flammeovirga kamogawensis]